jgi:hypothetical protein
MERSGVKCFHCTHVFDLTNLKGEKRRNVGKLNNELNIVNQLVDLHFLLFVNITVAVLDFPAKMPSLFT